MISDRQIQEVMARCVSIMVRYQNSERTSQSAELMVAEVRAVAGSVMELRLNMGAVDELILGPVATELIRRYGHEVGPRLDTAFSGAFEGLIETHYYQEYSARFLTREAAGATP